MLHSRPQMMNMAICPSQLDQGSRSKWEAVSFRMVGIANQSRQVEQEKQRCSQDISASKQHLRQWEHFRPPLDSEAHPRALFSSHLALCSKFNLPLTAANPAAKLQRSEPWLPRIISEAVSAGFREHSFVTFASAAVGLALIKA